MTTDQLTPNSQDITEKIISPEEANTYIEDKIKGAKMVGRGVFLILGIMTLWMLMLSYAAGNGAALSTDMATGAGLVLLFLGISVAIGFFIRSGQLTEEYGHIRKGDFKLDSGTTNTMRDKSRGFLPRYTYLTTFAISLFILCPVPLILAGLRDASQAVLLSMVALIFLMVATGVALIVPLGAQKEGYDRLLKKAEYAPENRTSNNRMEKIGAFYWPLITAIYVGWSLWTMDWGRTWIIWPVAAIVFGAIYGLVTMLPKN